MMQADTTQCAVRRKGARAVYNALRIQINHFEQAFVRLHGRPPKGSMEKAPLSATYIQYRELKRAIRADAAQRIQALFRGWKTRSSNITNTNETDSKENPKMTDPWNGKFRNDVSQQDTNSDDQISIVDISSMDENRGPVEIIGDPRVEENLLQQLSNHERDDASVESTRNSETSTSFDSEYSVFPEPIEDELGHLSLKDLRKRKRELKEQLKEYDIQFTIEHGRMPNKSEKEPIRYLYNRYNALKDRIAMKRS